MATNSAISVAVAANTLVDLQSQRRSKIIQRRSRGEWGNDETAFLIGIMDKMRGMIKTGEVMPGSYMAKACSLFVKRYKKTGIRAIHGKWQRLVRSGQVTPVVADMSIEVPDTVPSAPVSIPGKRNWSQQEIQIYQDILLGDNGLLQNSPGTIYLLLLLYCLFEYTFVTCECIVSAKKGLATRSR